MTTLPPALSTWFAAKGWTLHPHQEEMLAKANDPATLLIRRGPTQLPLSVNLGEWPG